MIEDILREMITRFNDKAASDEKLKAELAGMRRTILISLDDGRRFNFRLEDAKASALETGSIDNPDIAIESSEETIDQLYKGEMRVMRALALKKVRVNGLLQDILRLRKFF